MSRVVCLGWKATTSGGDFAWRLLAWHAAPRVEKSIHASGPPTYARTPLGVSGGGRAAHHNKYNTIPPSPTAAAGVSCPRPHHAPTPSSSSRVKWPASSQLSESRGSESHQEGRPAIGSTAEGRWDAGPPTRLCSVAPRPNKLGCWAAAAAACLVATHAGCPYHPTTTTTHAAAVGSWPRSKCPSDWTAPVIGSLKCCQSIVDPSIPSHPNRTYPSIESNPDPMGGHPQHCKNLSPPPGLFLFSKPTIRRFEGRAKADEADTRPTELAHTTAFPPPSIDRHRST